LAGELSLAIREGLIYGSIEERSCPGNRQEHTDRTREQHRRYGDRRRRFVVSGTLTAAVSSSDVQVNGARVTQADIVATNGIIHGIDAVILPKSWQLLAVAA